MVIIKRLITLSSSGHLFNPVVEVYPLDLTGEDLNPNYNSFNTNYKPWLQTTTFDYKLQAIDGDY